MTERRFACGTVLEWAMLLAAIGVCVAVASPWYSVHEHLATTGSLSEYYAVFRRSQHGETGLGARFLGRYAFVAAVVAGAISTSTLLRPRREMRRRASLTAAACFVTALATTLFDLSRHLAPESYDFDGRPSVAGDFGYAPGGAYEFLGTPNVRVTAGIAVLGALFAIARTARPRTTIATDDAIARRGLLWSGVAGAIAIGGVFLPWSGLSERDDDAYFHGIAFGLGWIVLGLQLSGLVLVAQVSSNVLAARRRPEVLARWSRRSFAVAALLCAAFALAWNRRPPQNFFRTSPAFGLDLAMLGSAVAATLNAWASCSGVVSDPRGRDGGQGLGPTAPAGGSSAVGG